MIKIRKKALSIILTLAMLISILPFPAAKVYAEEMGDWEYEVITRDGTEAIKITGYKGTDTKVTIPEEIDGKQVISIGSSAFRDCRKITSITIPESVTSIGPRAFYECNSLTDITIPKGVTSIEIGTFYGCNSLTAITIPEGVTSIGQRAFQWCGLTSITIPEGVTSIGKDAFFGCNKLTSITIPESVTSIGEYAFRECNGLTAITIPKNMTSIEVGTFYCCSKLTSITIPKNVTNIGDYAFFGCNNITSITIPENVTSIGFAVFSRCNNLMRVTVKSGNTIYDSRENCNAIVEKKSNTLIAGCQNTKIPQSVKSIGDYAFYNCENLTDIAIPQNVKRIGDYAFAGCGSLTSITLPKSVNRIESYTFYECYTLTIYGYPGSYVEKYGKENNIPFKNISEYIEQTSATTNSITLTWKKTSGAKYEIYRSTKEGSGYKKIATVSKNSYTDKKLKAGTTYYYKIRAVKTVGNTPHISSNSSVLKAVTKPAKTKVTLKAGKKQIFVSWKKVTGAVKYEVYLATAKKGKYKKLVTTSKTSYTKKKLIKGKKYYIKVRSYTTNGIGRKYYSAYNSVKSVKVK